ncbi:Type IV secretion system protein virB6 [Xanthomonas arboricola pv. juglandis]|nr:Type IV secretion system protein virB6 [Xanthomonas arboricola pv. juglandis]
MRMQATTAGTGFNPCASSETGGLELMSRAMKWVSTIALTVTTLWILILDYRIATGQSRVSVGFSLAV